MEMKGDIDPDVPLDYVELQIFPSQNRYVAYVCSSNRTEKAASGTLKQLLLHSTRVKDLSSKGSSTNFKILPPNNVNDADWFTTATLTRFLHILGSPDILGIGNEITQLEETRKFQLSLSSKAMVDTTSSIDSKNELLKAVDLRLNALKDEIVATFDQVTSARCSIKDVSDLENFAHHFGAKDIRDLLQKFVELSLFPIVEDSKTTLRYGLSPEVENSPFSSEEDQPSVDRCRAARRSATPRRAASPMRRIQIGRSRSHRTPALTIKSLHQFPTRGKALFQKDPAGTSSDEDDANPDQPMKKDVLRMSVQDKISLFESKQREQKVDIPKSKKQLNITVGPNKGVLRRWSSGMGENATHRPNNSALGSTNIAPEPELGLEPKPKPDSLSWVSNVNVTTENIKQTAEKRESCENHPESIEWNEQNEAKLDELLMKMMENTKTPNIDATKIKKSTVLKEERVEASGKKAGKKTDSVNKPLKEKSGKNSTPLMNSRKEALKPSVPATRKSWSSTPSPRTPAGTAPSPRTPAGTASAKPVGLNTKSEKSEPRSKTPKSTPSDGNRNLKKVNEKTRSTVTKSTKTTRPKVQSPEVKPSFYNKVTKKSSVAPLETKPFLRRGSGIGPGVGPSRPAITKSKAVDQPDLPEESFTISETLIQIDDNEVVMPTDVSENEEKCEPRVVSLSPGTSPSHRPTKCEEPVSPNIELAEVINENKEELVISPTVWEEETIPCLVQTESPVRAVVPTGASSSPRIRHSLSEMLQEESVEEAADVSEWGNAEHPPALVYQKDSAKGFKRLLKFARKTKAESALLEAEDLKVPDGQVSASLNTSKGTRSFFSLSAFRVSKTSESNQKAIKL